MLTLLSTILLVGCSDDKTDAGNQQGLQTTETYIERLTEVDTSILKRKSFYSEIISQGKIQANKKIDVPFTAQGLITEVPVKQGQWVEQGALLVKMDDFQTRNELQKLEVQRIVAQLNMDNHFINLGYSPDRKQEIPEEIRKNASIEFNLPGLEIDKERLEHQLEKARITAPFSGVITELKVTEGAHSSAYDKVCTLIDNQPLQIAFPVLESEMNRIKKGQLVSIEPYFDLVKDKPATGRITYISPQVDDEGMVQCLASIQQGGTNFIDGMRMNVYIRDEIPNVLVLPKNAVVDRQNRLVVFTLVNDRAYWNYVELGAENSDSYLIKDGIKEGDTIIMTHNFDLAHLEKVVVAK